MQSAAPASVPVGLFGFAIRSCRALIAASIAGSWANSRAGASTRPLPSEFQRVDRKRMLHRVRPQADGAKHAAELSTSLDPLPSTICAISTP
jgi:hypothetical protein